MFEDDIKIEFQNLPTLDFGDKKDRIKNISMNFENLHLSVNSVVDGLKYNPSILSNETKNIINEIHKLLADRTNHVDARKYNTAIADVRKDYPDLPLDIMPVSQAVVNSLRNGDLDKKAVFTNDYLLEVDKMAEKLLDTYVAHDLDKSNSIDKETASRITFFNKLDKDEI